MRKKINPPILCGMTPVKPHPLGDGLMACSRQDPDWYCYVPQVGDRGLSFWPNAVAADGSEFVWIPRYGYKIIHQQEKGKACKVTIDIIFINRNNLDEEGNKIPDSYVVPVAFSKQNRKLSGFWVGKYAASQSQQGVFQIKPGKQMMEYDNSVSLFQSCFKMAVNPHYGFHSLTPGDIQLITPDQWHSILYLAHSQYGRNGASIQENSTAISGGEYQNEYVGKIAQSTTHNLTGVFDIPGHLLLDTSYDSINFCDTFRMCIIPPLD